MVRVRKAISDVGHWAIVVQSAGYFVVGYILAQIATPHLLPSVAVIVLSLGACAVLVWIRFTAAGRAVLASNRATDWSGTASVALLLVAVGTAGFGVLSATLYMHGVGTIKGGDLSSTELVASSYGYYLWHLADAIPLLKVPSTLNWKLSHPFTDHVNGALALAYSILVTVPLLFAGAQVLRRWTSDEASGAASQDPAQPVREAD